MKFTPQILDHTDFDYLFTYFLSMQVLQASMEPRTPNFQPSVAKNSQQLGLRCMRRKPVMKADTVNM